MFRKTRRRLVLSPQFMKVIATGQPPFPLTDDGLTCHAAHTIKLAPDALFYPLGPETKQEASSAPPGPAFSLGLAGGHGIM